MALYWNFNTDYIGQVKIKGELPGRENETYTYNCYTGNALLIVLAETTKRYSLHFFLCNEDHLKNYMKDPEIVNFFRSSEFILAPCKNTDILFKRLKGIAKFTILRKDEIDTMPRYMQEEVEN